jgi:2-phosphoglycerate kinase
LSAEEIIKHQDAESEEVWVGVKALIDNSYPWKSFIIEGVAIVPHFVKQDFDKFENIKNFSFR